MEDNKEPEGGDGVAKLSKGQLKKLKEKQKKEAAAKAAAEAAGTGGGD